MRAWVTLNITLCRMLLSEEKS